MKKGIKKLYLFLALGLVGLPIISTITALSPMATQTVYAQDADPEEDPPKCEDDESDWVWAICPTLRMLDRVIGLLDDQIRRQLSIPNSYFNGTSGEVIEAAWARMRNIAYVTLVPVMLIMVIGTALGFDFVSAYTIKRALPRLVIAVVFIAISYEFCTFLIDLSNELGRGIQGFITASIVEESEIRLELLFDPDGADGSIFLLTAGAAGLVALGAFPLIFGYAVAVFISLVIGFLMLTLRRAFVIMMTILSPLAILSWIFPGNDKLWKLWWGTFWKLLAVYPLISLLVATSRVFASIIAASPNSGLVETGAAALVYAAGYAVGPIAVQRMSGAFGALTGSASGLVKGARNWAKGTGRKAAANRMKATAAGTNRLSKRSIIPIRMPNALGRVPGLRGLAGRRIGENAVGNLYRRGAMWNQGGLTSLNPLGYVPVARRIPIIGGWKARAQYDAAGRKMSDETAHKAAEAAQEEVGQDDDLTELLMQPRLNHGQVVNQLAAQMRADHPERSMWQTRREAELSVARATQYYGAPVGSAAMVKAAAFHNTTSTSNITPEAGGANAIEIEQARRARMAELVNRKMLTPVQQSIWTKKNKARPDQAGDSFGRSVRDNWDMASNFRNGARDPGQVAPGDMVEESFNRVVDRLKAGDTVGMNYRSARALAPHLYARLQRASVGNPVTGAAPDPTEAARIKATLANLHDVIGHGDLHSMREFEEQVLSLPTPGNPGVRLLDELNRLNNTDPATLVGTPEAVYHPLHRTWTQSQTGAAGAAGAGGGPGGPPGGASDRRLKRSIVPLGLTISDAPTIQLYRFKYLWSDQEYVGVMAQEVMVTRPNAVGLRNGFYYVNYDLLGTRMYTLEEWEHEHSLLTA